MSAGNETGKSSEISSLGVKLILGEVVGADDSVGGSVFSAAVSVVSLSASSAVPTLINKINENRQLRKILNSVVFLLMVRSSRFESPSHLDPYCHYLDNSP